MNKQTKIIVILVVVAVLAGVAILATSLTNKRGNTGTTENDNIAATVIYRSDGFIPAEVTVPKGKALRIINRTKSAIKPSSNNHPTHALNPELNFPEIPANGNATVTLTKVDAWGFHNEYAVDKKAIVIVE